jgi:hypothetical protein
MKTKLLREIGEQSDVVRSLCVDLSHKLADADNLENSHWTALSHIITARDTLDQNVRLLEGSIRAFEELQKKTALVQEETKAIHDLINQVIELMKQVSKRAAAH